MKIVECFKSIQGEGYNFGKEAVFLRLGNCNLKCPWCDTDWMKYKEIELEKILKKIEKFECKNIIITGGEPTIHDLTSLTKKLKEKNFWIAIETNGTNLIENTYIDYIATSPKFFYRKVVKLNLKKANEVRLVVDGENAEEFTEFCLDIEKQIKAKRYYLSPLEKGKDFVNLETLAKVKQNLNDRSENEWQISVQMHKLMNMR
nr:MAG TPA: organic radical activating enzyme [Caudoviricetes sp.]